MCHFPPIDFCSELVIAAGRYHENASDTLSGFSSPYEDLSYTGMGVAYNADIHYAQNVGDGFVCSGDSDTDCWGPQHWELRIEDAIANGAKVSNNSWSFDDDLFISTVTAWATANDKTHYEALVHFQGQKGVDSNRAGAVDDVFEIGLTTTQVDWTVTQWQEYVEALNTFQNTRQMLIILYWENLDCKTQLILDIQWLIYSLTEGLEELEYILKQKI